MFTGIIEEIGEISTITAISGGIKLRISADTVLDDLKTNDSIAINGVCLTATSVESDGFWVDAVGETLTKTTITSLHEGYSVNLERAMKLSDRLGGHLIQGHVNGIGTVSKIKKRGDNYFIEITIPIQLCRYVIIEGSIAIDGISLTVAQLNRNLIGLSIIPHTWKTTNLGTKKVSDKLNIEIDLIAKYVESLLSRNVNKEDNKFSQEWFKKLGY